jgi:hypothetical protein
MLDGDFKIQNRLQCSRVPLLPLSISSRRRAENAEIAISQDTICGINRNGREDDPHPICKTYKQEYTDTIVTFIPLIEEEREKVNDCPIEHLPITSNDDTSQYQMVHIFWIDHGIVQIETWRDGRPAISNVDEESV